jgi:hypothetical protein
MTASNSYFFCAIVILLSVFSLEDFIIGLPLYISDFYSFEAVSKVHFNRKGRKVGAKDAKLNH